MRALAFDHVALWVDQRAELASLLTDVSGMHEVERTDAFTLLGGDARLGKLTLFDAEGPRERGPLTRIVLRVPDLGACIARLEARGISYVRIGDGEVWFDAPSGVPLGVIQHVGVADLHAAVLTVADAQRTAAALLDLGFDGGPEELSLGDRRITLRSGSPAPTRRPLLNHLALLVESADDARLEAVDRGLEIDRVVDAPNTLAVFVRGPEGILLEYVEHKPSFSLV